MWTTSRNSTPFPKSHSGECLCTLKTPNPQLEWVHDAPGPAITNHDPPISLSLQRRIRGSWRQLQAAGHHVQMELCSNKQTSSWKILLIHQLDRTPLLMYLIPQAPHHPYQAALRPHISTVKESDMWWNMWPYSVLLSVPINLQIEHTACFPSQENITYE